MHNLQIIKPAQMQVVVVCCVRQIELTRYEITANASVNDRLILRLKLYLYPKYLTSKVKQVYYCYKQNTMARLPVSDEN